MDKCQQGPEEMRLEDTNRPPTLSELTLIVSGQAEALVDTKDSIKETSELLKSFTKSQEKTQSQIHKLQNISFECWGC
jgi:hypothetical protein